MMEKSKKSKGMIKMIIVAILNSSNSKTKPVEVPSMRNLLNNQIVVKKQIILI